MIEVADALRVLQHYAETDELTDEIFLLAADIDGNGMVTRSDAQAIMDYSGGLTDGAYYQLLYNQNRQVNIYNSIIYNGYTVAFQ